MTFRMPGDPASPSTEFVTWVKSVLDASAIFRFTSWVLLGAEFARQGFETFLPTAAPVVSAGTASQVSRTEAFQAVYLGFSGRSVLGNPTRFYIYGVDIDMLSGASTNADFRLTRGESGGVNSIITALEANNGLWAANDGNPVVHVKPYANLGVNAYRQRKRRG